MLESLSRASVSGEYSSSGLTEIGIALFAVLVPFLTGALESVAGRDIGTLTALAGLLPFLLLLLNLRSIALRENAQATFVLVLVAAWSGLGLFGVAWGYASEVISQSVKILAWGTFFYVCYVSARRDGSARRVLLLLGLSAVPAALDVLLGLLTGRLDYNPVQGQLSFETFSVNKSMTHVVLAFACLWLSLDRTSVFRRLATVILMLIYVAAIVLANARVAHIGLLVCLLAMVWRGRSAAIVLVGGVAAVLAAVPTLFQSVFIRWAALASGQSVGTIADRLLWWQRGWSAASEASPVFGIGKSFRNPLLGGTFPFHSIVVQVFVETGFAGVLAMSAVLLSILAFLIRSRRAVARVGVVDASFNYVQILAVFAVYLGMSLSENTFLSGFQNWIFWGALGAMAGALALEASVRPDNQVQAVGERTLPVAEGMA